MGDVVIVAYRPKPGREADLLELTRAHAPQLRALGLATNRPATVLRAKDGTVLAVFEWCAGAIATAHQNPAVQAMWADYAQVCDYAPLNTLPEAGELFATFEPVDA